MSTICRPSHNKHAIKQESMHKVPRPASQVWLLVGFSSPFRSYKLGGRKQESMHKVPMLASQVVLSRMQLALHAARRTSHGASRLVHAMSTWSVQARRAPSRQCRDARVHGHTTTAVHEMSTFPSPPPPPPRAKKCFSSFSLALNPRFRTV